MLAIIRCSHAIGVLIQHIYVSTAVLPSMGSEFSSIHPGFIHYIQCLPSFECKSSFQFYGIKGEL